MNLLKKYMYPLLETIKVTENRLQNLSFHNERINFTRKALFNKTDVWDVSELVRIPELNKTLIYKCRFLYSAIDHHFEFLQYTPRIISRLFLIDADYLDYSYKYADRRRLELLKQNIIDPYADILIIQNGCVSDSSFSNIAFYTGSAWVTPDTPLLRGTKRAQYIASGKIVESRIHVADIQKFEKARLINAMLDLEDSHDINVQDIVTPDFECL
jgi:4-amino-4-deoxychorismate lyase